MKELSAKELSEETAEVKSKKTVRLCKIMERPERYINTIQLVATFSNFVMAFIILYDFGKHFLLAGAIWLYIVLTFGVLIPKTLGTRYHKNGHTPVLILFMGSPGSYVRLQASYLCLQRGS